MYPKYDFHIHTTCSDGIDSPTRVVKKAYKSGLEAIAITDHDSIDAWEEGTDAADEYGIKLILGTELSVWHKFLPDNVRELHILGYNFDPDYKPLKKYLDSVEQKKLDRAKLIMENVNLNLGKKNWPPISDGEIEKMVKSTCGMFGLPSIGKYLVEQGYAANEKIAYEEFTKDCRVVNGFVHLPEACNMIRKAGGFSSLAHPYNSARTLYRQSQPDVEKLVRQVAPFVCSIEAYCYSQSHEEINNLLSLAKKYDLRITGGSDHHRGNRLGSVNIPKSVLDYMLERN